LIAWVGRMADFTVATDHRHSLGSAGSEESETKLRVEC
jgi:hypothetical protein